MRLDLPELVRPTTAISGSFMYFRCSSRSCTGDTQCSLALRRQCVAVVPTGAYAAVHVLL